MDRLISQCGLAEAGVRAEAALEGAAAELSLPLTVCERLTRCLADAKAAAADSSIPQPHLNTLNVFCSAPWHPALSSLSDAHLEAAYRLTDYLLLDLACLMVLQAT